LIPKPKFGRNTNCLVRSRARMVLVSIGSSYFMDVIGCLDPKTGKVTEYPFPDSENSIREFFLDDQGHMWYGSPSNNKVGCFYLADYDECGGLAVARPLSSVPSWRWDGREQTGCQARALHAVTYAGSSRARRPSRDTTHQLGLRNQAPRRGDAPARLRSRSASNRRKSPGCE